MSGYLLTEQAEQDLNDIWDYIAEQSVEQADAVIAEIRAALELLAMAPGIGHRRSDVKDPRYRFWRANRFIIAYLRVTRPLQVIRVVGWPPRFSSALLRTLMQPMVSLRVHRAPRRKKNVPPERDVWGMHRWSL